MALQDVINSLQNPAASRSAILQRLGIDATRAAGYGGNTQFDQGMSDLYRQGLQSASSLDTQEGDTSRNYQQSLAQAAIDRDRALELVKGRMASQGLTYSGINTDEINRTTSDWDRYNTNLGNDYTSRIGQIGTGRLNLEQGLQSGRGALESGYGTDLSNFLQQQALAMFASVVEQNRQNEMMAALNRPQPAPVYAAPKPPAAPRPPLPPAAPRQPANPLGMNLAGMQPKPPTRTLTPIRGRY